MYCTCNSDEKRVSLRFDVNHQSCNQDLSSLTNLNPNEVLPYMVFIKVHVCAALKGTVFS